MRETKEAQDTSFNALKTRTSAVSLGHTAVVQVTALLEENNARLQEELDHKVVERKQVDEMIGMGQAQQDLRMEKQKDQETIEELEANCDKRGAEVSKSNKVIAAKYVGAIEDKMAFGREREQLLELVAGQEGSLAWPS